MGDCEYLKEDEISKYEDDKNQTNSSDHIIEEPKHTLESFTIESRIRMDKLSKDISLMKEKFKEMAKIIEEIAEEILQLNYFKSKLQNKDDIMSMPIGVFLQPPLNTNGHLVWGIDNFRSKMDSAINEQRVYCSQTFLTKEFGYKFQVAAYLNGMGQWENKCMLFSIELCPTPWDILLNWPCRVKITITLVDQTKDRSQAKDETKKFKKVLLNKNTTFFRTFLSKDLLKENKYLSKDSILIVISVTEEQRSTQSQISECTINF